VNQSTGVQRARAETHVQEHFRDAIAGQMRVLLARRVDRRLQRGGGEPKHQRDFTRASHTI
jgi:hypothetical protein